jgi:hypothetical protein
MDAIDAFAVIETDHDVVAVGGHRADRHAVLGCGAADDIERAFIEPVGRLVVDCEPFRIRRPSDDDCPIGRLALRRGSLDLRRDLSRRAAGSHMDVREERSHTRNDRQESSAPSPSGHVISITQRFQSLLSRRRKDPKNTRATRIVPLSLGLAERTLSNVAR